MNVTSIELLNVMESTCCAIALVGLVRSKQVRQFPAFAAFLALRLFSEIVCLSLLEASSRLIERHTAYKLYFFTYWPSFAIESVLCLFVVLGVFRLAMAPLPGLQKLGSLVFRWAMAISVALALALGMAPHQTSSQLVVSVVSELEQISSVLTLCLLLFVCFAVRPLGLSFRSRVFGVSLGLGVMSVCSLTQAAWVVRGAHLDAVINSVASAVSCTMFIVWATYFLLPEPRRRIIVLPTTSPFLRWNQISEVLGDEPGFVAVAGIPPEVFAPAELEIMARASAKMPDPASEYSPSATPVTLKSLTA